MIDRFSEVHNTWAPREMSNRELWHWRAQLILTRRLTDVGEAPSPEPAGGDGGR